MQKLWCWMMVCIPMVSWAADEQVDIARFSKNDLNGWQPKFFSGETVYTLKQEHGRTALRADSNATASGLYRKVNIDLNKTPILNWSWKIDNILTGNDERTQMGDDYPARIYVVFSAGVLFWRTRAINYVWSNKQPAGSRWFNAFTRHAGMIAIQSGAARIGHWINESRNVMDDYRQLFGEKPGHAGAVAIMTDTDNTGATATAWYGDIWFSTK